MDINLFDFYLPEELIAQSPLKERENCKLLVINKKEKNTADRHFFDILEYFKEGDVLVRNNTKVSYKDVEGTWKLVDGTPYIQITIDGIEYKGVLDIQKDESKEHKERIVFSLVGNNNETLWGVKQ